MNHVHLVKTGVVQLDATLNFGEEPREFWEPDDWNDRVAGHNDESSDDDDAGVDQLRTRMHEPGKWSDLQKSLLVVSDDCYREQHANDASRKWQDSGRFYEKPEDKACSWGSSWNATSSWHEGGASASASYPWKPRAGPPTWEESQWETRRNLDHIEEFVRDKAPPWKSGSSQGPEGWSVPFRGFPAKVVEKYRKEVAEHAVSATKANMKPEEFELTTRLADEKRQREKRKVVARAVEQKRVEMNKREKAMGSPSCHATGSRPTMLPKPTGGFAEWPTRDDDDSDADDGSTAKLMKELARAKKDAGRPNYDDPAVKKEMYDLLAKLERTYAEGHSTAFSYLLLKAIKGEDRPAPIHRANADGFESIGLESASRLDAKTSNATTTTKGKKRVSSKLDVPCNGIEADFDGELEEPIRATGLLNEMNADFFVRGEIPVVVVDGDWMIHSSYQNKKFPSLKTLKDNNVRFMTHYGGNKAKRSSHQNAWTNDNVECGGQGWADRACQCGPTDSQEERPKAPNGATCCVELRHMKPEECRSDVTEHSSIDRRLYDHINAELIARGPPGSKDWAIGVTPESDKPWTEQEEYLQVHQSLFVLGIAVIAPRKGKKHCQEYGYLFDACCSCCGTSQQLWILNHPAARQKYKSAKISEKSMRMLYDLIFEKKDLPESTALLTLSGLKFEDTHFASPKHKKEYMKYAGPMTAIIGPSKRGCGARHRSKIPPGTRAQHTAVDRKGRVIKLPNAQGVPVLAADVMLSEWGLGLRSMPHYVFDMGVEGLLQARCTTNGAVIAVPDDSLEKASLTSVDWSMEGGVATQYADETIATADADSWPTYAADVVEHVYGIPPDNAPLVDVLNQLTFRSTWQALNLEENGGFWDSSTSMSGQPQRPGKADECPQVPMAPLPSGFDAYGVPRRWSDDSMKPFFERREGGDLVDQGRTRVLNAIDKSRFAMRGQVSEPAAEPVDRVSGSGAASNSTKENGSGSASGAAGGGPTGSTGASGSSGSHAYRSSTSGGGGEGNDPERPWTYQEWSNGDWRPPPKVTKKNMEIWRISWDTRGQWPVTTVTMREGAYDDFPGSEAQLWVNKGKLIFCVVQIVKNDAGKYEGWLPPVDMQRMLPAAEELTRKLIAHLESGFTVPEMEHMTTEEIATDCSRATAEMLGGNDLAYWGMEPKTIQAMMDAPVLVGDTEFLPVFGQWDIVDENEGETRRQGDADSDDEDSNSRWGG